MEPLKYVTQTVASRIFKDSSFFTHLSVIIIHGFDIEMLLSIVADI